MDWKPQPSQGGWVGLGLLGGLLLIDIIVLGLGAGSSIPFLRFVVVFLVTLSLPVVLVIAYWIYGFFTLRYGLNRNGLVICWGGDRRVVPVGQIQSIAPWPYGLSLAGGRSLNSSRKEQPGSFRGVSWPGYRIGQSQLIGAGPALFRSTAPLESSLLVVTSGPAYVISPAEPERFLRAWEKRRSLGPTQEWAPESRPMTVLTLPLWSDRLAWGLVAAALLLCAFFAAYVWARYPELPENLAFHFSTAGQADRIGNKAEILRLPVIGLLALFVNVPLGLALYGRERLAAYLAWGGGILVQLLLWLAALEMMGWVG